MKRITTLLLPAVCLTSSLAAAQTASAVLREGDTLVGAPAGHIVNSLTGTNMNNNGGYVVGVNSSDGTTTLSHAWGSANGASPGILLTEATYGPLVQTSFEGFLGVDDAGVPCISASGTGGPAGGFDSVWLGPTPIAVEGDPITTLPGKFFRFGSRPGATATGVPYFVGGITSTSGGSTENYALFYGLTPTAIIQGGDTLTGLPFAVSTSSGVSFDYRFSANGTHYIVEVKMGGSATTVNDHVMVIDGAGLMLGGVLVREDTPVPLAIGGLGGENWDNFDYMGVNEAGEYFFTGDTSGATGFDEIIVQNGLVRFREADVVDGHTLTGSIELARMSEGGGLAYIWDVDDGAGGSLEALFYEDTLLLKEGEPVDWDGDGAIDPASFVTNFTGTASLSFASNGVLWFTADVDDGTGTVLEGLFGLPVPSSGTPYCFGDGSDGATCPCGNVPALGSGEGCTNQTALGALITAAGSASVSSDSLTLTVHQAAQNEFGIFVQNVAVGAPMPFYNGVLCLPIDSHLVRHYAPPAVQPTVTDASGMGSNAQPLTDGDFLGDTVPGATIYYQFWGRDNSGPCGTGANFSSGLAILWGA